jgi:hypothetical protein
MLAILLLACQAADEPSARRGTLPRYVPPPDLDLIDEPDPKAPPVPAILLNELQSDNESTLQEADGTFSDWFEIYNASDEAVALDRIAVWKKDEAWRGAGGELLPGEHRLVKADGGLSEGSAPWTLDSTALSVTVDEMETDRVDAGPLPSDVAALRFPDGGEWRFGIRPTPGYANISAGTDSIDPRDSLFQKDHVPVVEIFLDDDAYRTLETQYKTDVEGGLLVDGIYFPSVGVKLKGSGSYQGIDGKAAFKIDLNDFDGTRRMRGLKKLTFNNGITWDPTWTHEWLSYSVFRAAGIAAPRVGWARVFVNGVDYGLYMNVETWDDELLERWFSDAQTGGTLYEGSDFSASVNMHLEEGPERTDWIEDVASHVGRNPTSEDIEALGRLIDMDEFTTYMAAEANVLQFDGYQAPNNWRLYITAGDVGMWLPTGLDFTWSYSWGDCYGGRGSVIAACLEDADCRDLYSEKLIEVADLIDSMDLVAEFDDLTAFLTPEIETDTRTNHSAATIGDAQVTTRGYLESQPEKCREQAKDELGL